MDFYNKPSPALFLMHYGVKGMKWGVRRTPEELGYKPKRTVEKNRRTRYNKDNTQRACEHSETLNTKFYYRPS